MIDLFGNRYNETFTYRKVSWSDFIEGANLGDVTSGRVELSAFSDLKATCSFTFEGQEEPDPNQLIRIYYSFDDAYDQHAEFCIGTFFVGFSEVVKVMDARYGWKVSGTADGWSVLKVLQDVTMGYPYTVPAGTNPIAKAIELMQDRNLRVNAAHESSYVLTSDHTFNSDDSLLTVVNWLCTAADYQAPYPDERGTVQIDRYISPDERSVVAIFENDDNSIMYPEVAYSSDWQSTINTYKMSFSSDTVAMHAEARNKSGSKASLDQRGGRENSDSEEVTELDGADSSEMLENLKVKAAQRLLDKSSEIERVQLSHPYIPLVPNDSVAVKYGGSDWRGSLQNMAINLEPATKCDTTLRRFVTNAIEIDTDGEIDWELSE